MKCWFKRIYSQVLSWDLTIESKLVEVDSNCKISRFLRTMIGVHFGILGLKIDDNFVIWNENMNSLYRSRHVFSEVGIFLYFCQHDCVYLLIMEYIPYIMVTTKMEIYQVVFWKFLKPLFGTWDYLNLFLAISFFWKSRKFWNKFVSLETKSAWTNHMLWPPKVMAH